MAVDGREAHRRGLLKSFLVNKAALRRDEAFIVFEDLNLGMVFDHPENVSPPRLDDGGCRWFIQWVITLIQEFVAQIS